MWRMLNHDPKGDPRSVSHVFCCVAKDRRMKGLSGQSWQLPGAAKHCLVSPPEIRHTRDHQVSEHKGGIVSLHDPHLGVQVGSHADMLSMILWFLKEPLFLWFCRHVHYSVKSSITKKRASLQALTQRRFRGNTKGVLLLLDKRP